MLRGFWFLEVHCLLLIEVISRKWDRLRASARRREWRRRSSRTALCQTGSDTELTTQSGTTREGDTGEEQSWSSERTTGPIKHAVSFLGLQRAFSIYLYTKLERVRRMDGSCLETRGGSRMKKHWAARPDNTSRIGANAYCCAICLPFFHSNGLSSANLHLIFRRCPLGKQIYRRVCALSFFLFSIAVK